MCPQILGQIRPQISWIPKFVPKFRDKFVPIFGESSNFGTNFGMNSSPITPTTSWAYSVPNLRTTLSPNLGSYQIFPHILGKLFKPIKVLTKFIPKFSQISGRIYPKKSCKLDNRHHPSLKTILRHKENSLGSIIIPSRMTPFFIPILYICKLQFVCRLLFITSFFLNWNFDQLRIGLLLWYTF